MPRSVLVVEDDLDLARLVTLHLRDIGCDVECAHDGVAGLERASSGEFGLVILDLGLPRLSGLEICRRLRERPNYTPILMLTAKSAELERVFGLETGADDYLTKPFSILELVARVKAIFRRSEALQASGEKSEGETIVQGHLQIDPERRCVRLQGEEVELTAREFDLLSFFAHHPGRVFSRLQLLDKVWGYGHDGYQHTVNSHINRLRAKIEENPRDPKFILTVWGVGYKFSETPPGGEAS
jgi:DNA-binding response OmpR family regulator